VHFLFVCPYINHKASICNRFVFGYVRARDEKYGV
jgi:hypothetical protein